MAYYLVTDTGTEDAVAFLKESYPDAEVVA